MRFILFLFAFTCFHTQAQNLSVHKTITQDSLFLSFVNEFQIPIEVNISPLDSTRNYMSTKNYALLFYNDTLKNAVILPMNKVADTSSIHLKKFINFKGSFGHPDAQHDQSKYVLPFLKGKKYEIMQSFGGNFSHNLKSSYYAIDFSLPIGDTIVAARSGKVFFVKEDSKEHCRTRKCMDKANKILILHKDGTYANYVHLNYNGAFVEVGDQVQAGDVIGISGMTGFTTKPHLHFVVHKAKGVSVPVYFKGMRKKKLKKGKLYKRKK